MLWFVVHCFVLFSNSLRTLLSVTRYLSLYYLFTGIWGWKYFHSNSVSDEKHSFRFLEIGERLEFIHHCDVKPGRRRNQGTIASKLKHIKFRIDYQLLWCRILVIQLQDNLAVYWPVEVGSAVSFDEFKIENEGQYETEANSNILIRNLNLVAEEDVNQVSWLEKNFL